MSINDRIQHLIELLTNGKQRPLALKAGISTAALNGIIGARKNDPTFTTLKKIIDAYPNINLDWLINENGEPLKSIKSDMPDQAFSETDTNELNKKDTEISERVFLMIQKLSSNPNSFAAGLGYTRSQTIYDILNGKSAPSYDFFRRFMLSPYSQQISIDWLLTGRGKMTIEKG